MEIIWPGSPLEICFKQASLKFFHLRSSEESVGDLFSRDVSIRALLCNASCAGVTQGTLKNAQISLYLGKVHCKSKMSLKIAAAKSSGTTKAVLNQIHLMKVALVEFWEALMQCVN